MSNIKQDFIKAKNILIRHRGTIRERLIAAGRTGITVYETENLPTHLQEDYELIQTKLSEQNSNVAGDGLIEQVVLGISEEEASEIAELIADFAEILKETPGSKFR